MSGVVSAKKRSLLAYKDKLLNDIGYCEKRIKQARLECSDKSYYEDEDDSSDSDTGLPRSLCPVRHTAQLNAQQANLSVCLQATQELTSLQVLQSEVNVLVDVPEIEHRAEVPSDGTWREVTAECRVDLVPFSMTFFVHRPSGKFSALSYHNLCVTAVKPAHDKELSQSVFTDVKTPSDAVQVIRSYALAHRSRRTTLARLADRFSESLFMETVPTGGYLLKCMDVLQVSWTLQNKWSHIAPFHHRMKFDLEYMDERYVKEIKHLHSQLIDPTIETNERTNLLARIIETCLEANRAPTESDTDTEGPARRTTLDAEPEMSQVMKRSGDKLAEVGGKKFKGKDLEVMAPPKQLPKKGKPKGKVNGAVGKAGGPNGEKSGQKSKDNLQNDKVNGPNEEMPEKKGQEGKVTGDKQQKGKEKVSSSQKGTETVVPKDNTQKLKNNVEVTQKDERHTKKYTEQQQQGKQDSAQKSKVKTTSEQNNKENEAKVKKVLKKVSDKVDYAKKAVKRPLETDNVKKTTNKANPEAVSKKVKVTEESKVKKPTNPADDNPNKQKNGNEKPKKTVGKNQMNTNKDGPNTKSNTETKKPEKVKETAVKVGEGVDVAPSKPTAQSKTTKSTQKAPVEKIISGNIAKVPETVEKTQPKTTKTVQNTNKIPPKNPPNNKVTANKTKVVDINENDGKVVKTKIPLKTVQNINIPVPKADLFSKKPTAISANKVQSNDKVQSNYKVPSNNKISTQMTKIPQKKPLNAASDSNLRRFVNPLRISPRKTQSAVKPGQPAKPVKQLDAVRNSPRLLQRPVAKPKSMFVL